MSRYVIVVVFAMSLICGAQDGSEASVVALPNPGLLGCSGAECAQLWLDEPATGKALYPKQLMVDISGKSPYGIMATYDKNTSIEAVRTSIRQHYEKWALRVGGKVLKDLWRVEPEKFAVSLSTTDDGEARVIYLAFQSTEVVLCNMARPAVGSDTGKYMETADPERTKAPASK